MTRDRRERSPAIVLVLGLGIALAVGACGDGPSPTPGLIATSSIVAPASGSPASSAGMPVSPVAGVLTHIDSEGLSKVTGFRLRLDDGTEVSFTIGTLENDVEFPPGHLAEHLATSSPVRVFFRAEAGSLVVYRLEDAST